MVAGSWLNADGLPLQYGTSKALPEAGGDYLAYGDTREIGLTLNLCAPGTGAGGVLYTGGSTVNTSGGYTAQFTSGTAFQGVPTTANFWTGIVSNTTLFPLQTISPTLSTTSIYGASGTGNIFSAPQLVIEEIDVYTIIGMTATGSATGISLGLVYASPETSTGTAQQYIQVTPNAGVQLLSSLPNAAFTTAGQRVQVTKGSVAVGTTGMTSTGSGSWLSGQVPLVTNSTLPNGSLPTTAFLSIQSAGGYYTLSPATAGLIEVRIKYHYVGQINQ